MILLKGQAFERWNKLPAFLKTEMDNLTMGIAEGYTMPKEIVAIGYRATAKRLETTRLKIRHLCRPPKEVKMKLSPINGKIW